MIFFVCMHHQLSVAKEICISSSVLLKSPLILYSFFFISLGNATPTAAHAQDSGLVQLRRSHARPVPPGDQGAVG